MIKIQNEANKSTSWIKDNKLVCSGEKTKLLIIGTAEQKRKLKNDNIKIQIDVCGEAVEETESEKLLGLIINGDLTWKHYLYGEKWRKEKEDNFPGLIPKLIKRVGLLKHLRNKMNDKTFKMITNGIFSSLLNYCLPVFGNIWIDNEDNNKGAFNTDCKWVLLKCTKLRWGPLYMSLG